MVYHFKLLPVHHFILNQKSPSFLQFFNLQTTLLKYRGSASSCTPEMDEYPWDSPAVTSFCFNTQGYASDRHHTASSSLPCVVLGFGGFLTVLSAPCATGRAELNVMAPVWKALGILVPCFPDENQEIFFPPLEKATFLTCRNSRKLLITLNILHTLFLPLVIQLCTAWWQRSTFLLYSTRSVHGILIMSRAMEQQKFMNTEVSFTSESS